MDLSQSKCIAVRTSWLESRLMLKYTKDYRKSMRRFSSTKKILLITEDEGVIRDAEENFSQYDWYYTNYPRENKHDIGVAMAEGEVDPTEKL